jgi:hypothetical protein
MKEGSHVSIRDLDTSDPHDVQARFQQMLDIGLLMGCTAFRQDLEKRVPYPWLRQSAFRRLSDPGRKSDGNRGNRPGRLPSARTNPRQGCLTRQGDILVQD